MFNPTFTLTFSKNTLDQLARKIEKRIVAILVLLLSVISIACFVYYLENGLGLAYNDARSHLDIARRVVEGLKPGLAQLGSVWLPLPHVLMLPTIWNDFFWHTGLSGALPSMISFVVTGIIIYRFLERLQVSLFGRLVGVATFVLNLNILYLQSTAMTELLLIATMTIASYELLVFYQDGKLLHLVKTAFWTMLSTLVRYDGWFLLFYTAILIALYGFRSKGMKKAEGMFVIFCTLAGFGVFLWLVWNAAIFKDPLYFAFGPYSAHAQQEQLEEAGVLITKGHVFNSLKTYWYALVYNSGTFSVLLALLGSCLFFIDKHISHKAKIASSALLTPLAFNILALYLGHSVLFIQGMNGNTWFNVRYGIMLMPAIAIFIGYLVHRLQNFRWQIAGLLFFVMFFAFTSGDAVTIDDGRVGSSQKNVSEVSNWLKNNSANEPGFVLISAASHDAIIFSSGMPMKKFIHEGTGLYWKAATATPDRWARWIVMRTNDNNDQTFRLVNESGQLYKYDLVESYPFAAVYELKDEYMSELNTEATIQNNK
jgi:hypothetical protein